VKPITVPACPALDFAALKPLLRDIRHEDTNSNAKEQSDELIRFQRHAQRQ
jgi:hypothetical protein